jgi:hypothetical protein
VYTPSKTTVDPGDHLEAIACDNLKTRLQQLLESDFHQQSHMQQQVI